MKDVILTAQLAEMGPSMVSGIFYNKLSMGLQYHVSGNRSTDKPFDKVLEGLMPSEVLDWERNNYNESVALKIDDVVVLIRKLGPGEGYRYAISGDCLEKVLGLEKRLVALLPETSPEGNLIDVNFWTYGPHGPVSRKRRVTAPSWEDISINYPLYTGRALEKLLAFKPGSSGQLLLLHGKPGTGKSYVIRMLLREWRDWCSAHYIVDPDQFFGQKAEYMLGVLLEGSTTVVDDAKDITPPKWHLYIVEDGDEFLTEDAKSRSGQALSRLLNVVDGMIGQGLQILVLVTTNEPLGNLHPAVIRPGRCKANIEFRPFNKYEAEKWLQAKGYESQVKQEMTLAEMYGLGLSDGQIRAIESSSIGFVGVK